MVIDEVSLIVSIFTAIIALFIAYKQWSIERYKLKHEIIDK